MGPEILHGCCAPRWCWWPLWGGALKVLGLSCYCSGAGKEVQWKSLRLWHHFDLIIYWICTLDFIWRTFLLLIIFFLSIGFKVLGEETKVPSWLQQYVSSVSQDVFSLGKVNEIKDKSLQDNCQYCIFDTVFTVKLLLSGRFRGWTQVFQVQGSSQHTTCLFKYFWRSENKYGLFVYGE